MSEKCHIRDFQAADAEQVALLWHRSFRRQGPPPGAAVQRYFVDTLLKNPWYEKDLGSLVLEQHGEIVGFVGRMCRPMYFGQELIRCAVATQLMVDPERKLGFSSLELVRTLFAGPQDLLYSDGANEQSLKIWTRMGGRVCHLLSMEWTRRLRPAQAFLWPLREHPRLSSVTRRIYPLAGLYDRARCAALPRLYHRPVAHLTRRFGAVSEIAALLQRVSSAMALRPCYTPRTLGWLLDKSAEAKLFGRLRTMLVLDQKQTPVGWFVYYARAGEPARVLQVGAVAGYQHQVISELFCDAWDRGAVSVTGQLDPLLLIELSNSHTTFRCDSIGVLVHSRRSELLHAIDSGNAFLSRLEGEWWLRLGIDRTYAW